MKSITKRNRYDEMLQTEQLADKIELIQIVAEKRVQHLIKLHTSME